MNRLGVALLAAGLVCCLCFPAAAQTGAYTWAISASSTDPDVNTAAPAFGTFSVYLWLTCNASDGVAAAAFRASGSLMVMGFTPAQPTGITIWNVGAGPAERRR